MDAAGIQSATTRDRILSVARELAVARGFGATSYRDIGTRLGITKAAIYYHYPSKDELLLDLVGPLLQATDDLIERAAAAQPPIPPQVLLDRYLRVLLAHRAAAALLVGDVSVTNHPAVGPRLHDHHRGLRELLAGPDADEASETHVAAALGALRNPLVVLDTIDVSTLRRVAVGTAAAALGPATPEAPSHAVTDGGQAERKAQVALPPEQRSVATARRFVAATLKDWHLDHAAEAATLLTSELVTNAVVHAQTDLIVSISCSTTPLDPDDDHIRVEVVDYDDRLPAFNPGAGLSARGRGLVMVDSQATAWGIERRQAAKSVWFEIQAAPGNGAGLPPIASQATTSKIQARTIDLDR